jgi:tetratricopeptide (TPR) repeat protein
MLRRTLLTVLSLPLCAQAAQPDRWLRMQTANFELFTDAGEHTGRDILRQFERVHSFFEQVFGNKRANAKPVCLIAFRSAEEYQPYKFNQVAAVYFQPGSERDYIVMTGGVTDDARVAVHEYTHLMIHQSGQRLPLWLNEGTAELFSTMESRGAKVLVGNVIPSHGAVLARNQWIDVATLLTADHSSSLYNEKNHAGIFYAESWLLVHMVNLDGFYRPHLREFMAAVQENGAPAAFQQVYQKSLAGVQEDLYKYSQRRTVTALLFPVQLQKSADDPEVQPGAEFGARLALAELVSDNLKKHDQARMECAGLARDYPDKWEVEAGLAQMYWRERNGAEAAKHYARALEMGCKDQHAYIEYGKLLGFSGREMDAAGVLRSAVQLDSTNQQAHYELGIALSRSGEYRAALAEFKSLPHVTAEEASRYFYHFAYALYRDGQSPQARAALEKGKPYAKNDQERNNYASLFAAIDARTTVARLAPARADAPPDGRALEPPPTRTEVGGPPRLVHRDAKMNADGSVTLVRNPLPSMEGQLTRFECNGKQAVLHLTVNNSEEIFVIEDPQKVMIRSGDGVGAPVDFQCGPQKNQRLRVECQDSTDAAGNVTRFARILEFR